MGISKDIYIGEEEYYKGSDMQDPEFLEIPKDPPPLYAMVNIAYYINKIDLEEGVSFRQESFYGKESFKDFMNQLEYEDNMSSITIAFV